MKVEAMFSIRQITLLLFLSFFFASCANTKYVGKLVLGEAKILGSSIPYQEIIEDKKTADTTKEKILLVQEVKVFAQKLGLRLDGSYETFYHVKGDALIYLVSACPKDSLNPYTWRFPVVGSVEYKGFFERNDAVNEIKKLEKKGMDTCLQQAIAFSTLGWLRDPIYSTLLEYHPAIIINIIIHELVHNTLYFKGYTEFNEQIASFIALKASLIFIKERFGVDSNYYQRAMDFYKHETVTAEFFQWLYDVLKGFYAQDLSPEEKIRLREKIFNYGQRRMVDLGISLKTDDLSNDNGRLNNAVVLANRRYLVASSSVLQQAYEVLGDDVKSLIRLLFSIRKSKVTPYHFLEKWLQANPKHPSG